MRHAIVSGINLLGLFHLVGARRDDELAKLLEHEGGEAPSRGEKSCCCFDAGGDTFDTCMEVKVKLPMMLRLFKVELTDEERRDFCLKQLTSANGLTYNRYPAEATEELVECGTKHATCEDGEMSIKALLGLVRPYWQARVPRRCGDRLQEQFAQRFQLLIILERIARRFKLFKTCDFMEDAEEMSDLFQQFRRLAYMVMPCKTTDGRSFFYGLLKGLNGRHPHDIFKVVKKATYEVLSCEAVWAKEEGQHLSEGGCDVEFKSALAAEKKFKEDDWNQYKKWATDIGSRLYLGRK